MKTFLLALALLFCMQADAIAQHVSKQATHRKTSHRKYHKKTRHRKAHNSPYDRAYSGPKSDHHDNPSGYEGKNTPINDGHKKNMRRNLNYGNSQPLPASNGK